MNIRYNNRSGCVTICTPKNMTPLSKLGTTPSPTGQSDVCSGYRDYLKLGNEVCVSAGVCIWEYSDKQYKCLTTDRNGNRINDTECNAYTILYPNYAWCPFDIDTYNDDMRKAVSDYITATEHPIKISDWKTGSITNMTEFFELQDTFNEDISGWDVSSVTNMKFMFDNAQMFNRSLSSWNVSNVTDMSIMFAGASSFNQDISGWTVGSVIDMNNMFTSAHSFNKDISRWNVSSVTDMNVMFSEAKSFNQNISEWNVGNVINMNYMFYKATSFNQDISGWNVGSVTDMSEMFQGASSFNQDLSSLDMTNVTTFTDMLKGTVIEKQPVYYPKRLPANSDGFYCKPIPADGFSDIVTKYYSEDKNNIIDSYGDIEYWDVSSVTNMDNMPVNPTFNKDISRWDVSNVTNMHGMFWYSNSFNQDISGWNVDSVTNMNYMFSDATRFNQNISSWDVSSVTSMSGMFSGATSFNQDISGWDVISVTDSSNFIDTDSHLCSNLSFIPFSDAVKISICGLTLPPTYSGWYMYEYYSSLTEGVVSEDNSSINMINFSKPFQINDDIEEINDILKGFQIFSRSENQSNTLSTIVKYDRVNSILYWAIDDTVQLLTLSKSPLDFIINPDKDTNNLGNGINSNNMVRQRKRKQNDVTGKWEDDGDWEDYNGTSNYFGIMRYLSYKPTDAEMNNPCKLLPQKVQDKLSEWNKSC
tara:strand:+ start:2782 stop:4884 length:2103 start_codon:yes stop_codon:yes gene_type:complete